MVHTLSRRERNDIDKIQQKSEKQNERIENKFAIDKCLKLWDCGVGNAFHNPTHSLKMSNRARERERQREMEACARRLVVLNIHQTIK